MGDINSPNLLVFILNCPKLVFRGPDKEDEVVCGCWGGGLVLVYFLFVLVSYHSFYPMFILNLQLKFYQTCMASKSGDFDPISRTKKDS